MKNLITAACVALLLTTLVSAPAATVQLSASQDNTLYEPYSGSTTNSNGAGEHLFAGRNSDGYIRRALIAFNITNVIPSGSTITGATLVLYMSRTRDTVDTVTLHRLLAKWGEGPSNALLEEGKGAPALPGDATWVHRFYPTSFWAAPGGDYITTASASLAVNKEASYSWSSPGLVADVQTWLNNPSINFGWLIRGDETTSKTTKRFESRESLTVAQQPILRISFIPPSPVGACCLADGSCSLVSSNQCSVLGGTYGGDNSSCSPNPCRTPVGACCLDDGTCSITNMDACMAKGGSYQGDGTTCSSNLCSVILTPFVDPLPRPAVAQPVTGVPGGTASYALTVSEFKQKLHRDLPLTTVWGFSGTFPGPTIEAGRDLPVTITWSNNLRDASGHFRTNHYLAVDTCLNGPDALGASPRIVAHLHGGHVSPPNDGYPENTILPGQSANTFYPNHQPAGNIWYHDHAMGITRLNVYMGLAGFYLIRDASETLLNLPSGEFEIPLALQDRSFNSDGSLRYPSAWQEHFFGNTVLVNGKAWPYLQVKRGKYRFRILDGSSSRSYTLALSSGALFQQIGTDGGLLPQPVPLSELTLSPGERADVIMDFAAYPAGTEILLTNSAPSPFPGSPGVGVIPNIMKFVVTSETGHTVPVPASLQPLERLSETNAFKNREFILRKISDACTGSRWAINDLGWMDITEYPILGTTETWSFINRSGVSHPMHMHLVLFQILDRQPFNVSNNIVVPSGPRVPPAPNEAGWKDTVRVNPGEIVRVIARFEDFTGRYPYHCHILEHEDNEMMRQFEVVAPPLITGLRRSGSDILLDFSPSAHHYHAVEQKLDLPLPNWIPWISNILGSNSTITVTNTGAATLPRQFYRIRVQP